MNQLAEETSFVGGALAIVDAEGIHYAEGFGYADQAAARKYTATTVQPIASVSKTLAGVALMQAQQMGLLDLDDPINNHLPFEIVNPHVPGSPITIRHLASHTSGISDVKGNESSYIFSTIDEDFHKQFSLGIRRFVIRRTMGRLAKNVDKSMAEFISDFYVTTGANYSKKNFTKHAAGGAFHYSNNNTAIAALILEQAAGVDYSTFVATHILHPLGLQNASWSTSDFNTQEKSLLYFGGFRLPEYKLITYPDGGFNTTLLDFSTYFISMIQGYQGTPSILSAESFREMFARQINDDFGAGIFWELYDEEVGHAGGDPGVRVYAHFSRSSGKGHIVFLNTSETRKFDKDMDRLWQTLDKYSALIRPE
ncbi:MAG: serine hydrolase domain-containing protein [Bacteroidota bacterium]